MVSSTNFLVEKAGATLKPADPAGNGLQAFPADIDGRMAAVDMNRVERLSFLIDDIPYHVRHARSADNERSNICIQAIVGFLPFSAESDERRKSILSIIAATTALPHVRFGRDNYSRIFAAGSFTAASLAWPDFIFQPLMGFHQEARPFMDLIGRYF